MNIKNRYGRLSPIGDVYYLPLWGRKVPHVKVRCDCGTVKDVMVWHLHKQYQPLLSCGCYLHDRQCDPKTHGKANTRLYRIYRGMLARCYNKNRPAYPSYGGRGITVCKKWRDDFMTFYEWALLAGYEEHLSIERVDNDKGYEPTNCTWIERNRQQENQQQLLFVTAFGETKYVKKWADDPRCVVSATTLRRRVHDGWDSERAITEPAFIGKNQFSCTHP